MTDYTNKVFKLNAKSAPMVETDYYVWLEDNWTGERLKDKVSYLESMGFRKGLDTVSGDALNALGYIHDQYFRNEVVS